MKHGMLERSWVRWMHGWMVSSHVIMGNCFRMKNSVDLNSQQLQCDVTHSLGYIELNLPDPEIKILRGERVLQNKMETYVINNQTGVIATSLFLCLFQLPQIIRLFSIMTATARNSSTAPVDSTAQIISSPTCRLEEGCMCLSAMMHVYKKRNRKCDNSLRENISLTKLTRANVTPLPVMPLFFKTWQMMQRCFFKLGSGVLEGLPGGPQQKEYNLFSL